jgi:hypothetical protein
MDVIRKASSKRILFLLLCGATFLSGCGGGSGGGSSNGGWGGWNVLKGWNVAKCYSGPERPLSEVAVLFRQDAMLETIDEARLVLNDPELKQPAIPYTEYHLLPGKHTFESVFVKTNSTGMCFKPYDTTNFVVLTHEFKKGHVYTLKGSRITEKFATVKIVSDGSVNEMAPEISSMFFNPKHWNELAMK